MEQGQELLLEGLSYAGLENAPVSFEGLDGMQSVKDTFDELKTEKDDPEPDPKDQIEDPEKKVEKIEEDDKPEEDDAPEETVLDFVKKSFGYEIEGEFEDTQEGLLDYMQKVVPKAAEEKVKEIFESFPEVGNLYQHLAQGYSLDSFVKSIQQPEFAEIELAEDNVRAQKEVIRSYGKLRGLSEEDTEDLIDAAESKDQLYTRAQAYQAKIKEFHQQEIEQRKLEEKAAYDKQQQEFQQTVKQAQEIITKGKILNQTIPVVEQKRFFDYLFKPVTKDGFTQADLASQELDINQRLYLSYLTFKGLKPQETQRKSLTDTFRKGTPQGQRREQGSGIENLKPITDLLT